MENGSTAGIQQRQGSIPLWVKLLFTAFVCVLVSYYWHDSPDFVLVAIPFLVCSITGAVRGRRRFGRMLLYGGIGGTLSMWIGLVLKEAYLSHWDFGRTLDQTVRTIRDGFFIILVIRGIVFFVLGMVAALAVWVTQRLWMVEVTVSPPSKSEPSGERCDNARC